VRFRHPGSGQCASPHSPVCSGDQRNRSIVPVLKITTRSGDQHVHREDLRVSLALVRRAGTAERVQLDVSPAHPVRAPAARGLRGKVPAAGRPPAGPPARPAPPAPLRHPLPAPRRRLHPAHGALTVVCFLTPLS